MELATRNLRIVIEDDIYRDGLEKRIVYLSKLEEEREEIIDHIMQYQMQVKNLFNKKARPWKLMVGDSVLLWDKKNAPKGTHKCLTLYGRVHLESIRNSRIIPSN